jgi:indolepyruvate ferredoxin oxidoreductase beta subunit
MKFDLLLAGVGGQGVLSMAAIIGRAAMLEGLQVKQSEVHGMAQRGGAVLAHLRLADRPIASDLIPRGAVDLILGMEPVESLRYIEYLAPAGVVVTASNAFVNIPDYPDTEAVLKRVRALPGAVLVDAEGLANQAGDVVAVNTVMVGAAARLLPLRLESLERVLRDTFRRKGEWTMQVNEKAFALGLAAGGASGAGRADASAGGAGSADAPAGGARG